MVDRDLSGHTLGGYLLVERIGRGGSSFVYRCEQPPLSRHVVVKVLRGAPFTDRVRNRFLREAKLASSLDHPFACHILGFGADGGGEDEVLWIAMEFVQGSTLRDWLRA